jgi:hypothetical protein
MNHDTIAKRSIAPSGLEFEDSPAYQALIGLGALGIRYCLWKSIDRFEEGIQGKTDFDVLVDKAAEEAAFRFLQENGWVRLVAEPWRRFPEVHDFFLYDPKYRTFIHLHVHFRLIMGEKMTKGLSLPLEEIYLNSTVELAGVPCVLPELELVVFILRASLKITWRDYARIVRRWNRKAIYISLESEFQDLLSRCTEERLERVLHWPEFSYLNRDLIYKIVADLHSMNFFDRRSIRAVLKPYRRHRGLAGKVLHLFRSAQKRYSGLGKTVARGGKSFAFCGPDGSGKTTLVNLVQKKLANDFKVRRFYMGGNRTSGGPSRWLFNQLAWFPYLVVRKGLQILTLRQAAGFIERLYFGFDNFLMSREKRCRFRAGQVAMARGEVVLFERFPVFEGAGDGGYVGGCFEEAARRAYGDIGSPHALFVFSVAAAEAERRKPDHKPEVIRAKVFEFDRFIAANKQDSSVVPLDGNAPLDENLDRVLAHISAELSGDR